MQELDTPTFRLAVAQFDQAAEAMGLDPNLRERLKLPQRSLVVSLPVRMDLQRWRPLPSRREPR
jgi:glutamate dehydrogenase (NAD(P)+)